MNDGLFTKIIADFDAYNSKDPNTERVAGVVFPKELLYAQRMSQRLEVYFPEAPVHLRLAARCQHIGRWEIARDKYPMNRTGYLKWRTVLKKHHAQIVNGILTQHGVAETDRALVTNLILKANLKTNKETQVLEDVVCMVFLEFYIEEFAEKHDDEKLINILYKTMKKMSNKAITTAGIIKYSERIKGLVEKAAEKLED
jgi:hypothetical protein